MKNLNLFIIIIIIIIGGCTSNNNTTNDLTNPTILHITKIVPDSANIGDMVLIIGTGFGLQYTNNVYFDSSKALSPLCVDSAIEVKVPIGATSGKIWVTFNGKKSNEIDFRIVNKIDVTTCVSKWMLKNLDVDHYRNGDSIPEVTDPTEWDYLTTGAWCYYNNDSILGKIYGKLYNWYAVNDKRGLAPLGWHIASHEEWKELEFCLGGTNVAGGKLKEKEYWNYPNTGANNESGFCALPGGRVQPDGDFFDELGMTGYWWTANEFIPKSAWISLISFDDASLNTTYYWVKLFGFSVRCVKD